jgi:hypothetical protein
MRYGHAGSRRLLDNTGESAANFRRVTGMSGEMDGEALRQELDQNVVESRDLPAGYTLEGPAEPGADADVPGVLGGPGITIVSADEDEPGSQWSEHPR